MFGRSCWTTGVFSTIPDDQICTNTHSLWQCLHHSKILLKLTLTCSINKFISRYTDTLKWTDGVYTDIVVWAKVSLIGHCLQTLVNICVQLRQVAMKVKAMSSLDAHTNTPPQLVMSFRSIYPSPHEHSKDPKVFVQVWLQGLVGTHSSLSIENNSNRTMNVIYSTKPVL